MEKVEIKTSVTKYLILLIPTFGFVGGGIFLVVLGESRMIGWMSIIFFGSMIPLFIWQIFDSRPRLIIDQDGVYDKTLKVGLIPWTDIETAYIKSIQGNSFVCLSLKNTDAYLDKLSPLMRAATKANEKLGFTPLSLNLSGLKVDPVQVLDVVLKNSQATG